jgi:hypothetical protein
VRIAEFPSRKGRIGGTLFYKTKGMQEGEKWREGEKESREREGERE